jgi:hypothetical protein
MARTRLVDSVHEAGMHRKNLIGELNFGYRRPSVPEAALARITIRVEAPIFASPRLVPQETLVRPVGGVCRLDDLLADVAAELRARAKPTSTISRQLRLAVRAGRA